jgi:hypothetical protein
LYSSIWPEQPLLLSLQSNSGDVASTTDDDAAILITATEEDAKIFKSYPPSIDLFGGSSLVFCHANNLESNEKKDVYVFWYVCNSELILIPVFKFFFLFNHFIINRMGM